jgi:response regulator RpfG family c-di-GMP phosphodiesterase
LLDIQMPGCTGWEIAEQLRATLGRSLRIVMVSANAHEYRAGGDGQSHHDAFLSKPVDLDALLDMVGRQLGLDWIASGDGEVERAAGPSSGPLPRAAEPYLVSLRHHVKTGHVRGIEKLLAELEAEVPDSAAAVAEMRRHLDDFDLRGLARRLGNGD